MWFKRKLNYKRAQAMLRELSDFYGEPVMPASRYFAAIETWAHCVQKLNLQEQDRIGYVHGKSYHFNLEQILHDLKNSNLLSRIIYRGESLRYKRCPKHNGRWYSVEFDSCEHGCDGTGWLKQ